LAPEYSDQIRDHWYWRPGWSVGRRFYTWHLTFADQPGVADFAATYRDLLEARPETDPIPADWLHLTMQGVGFIDEVDRHDIDKIVDAARRRCAQLEPFVLTVGAPYIDPESVQIAVQPPEPVRELRLALRAAIGEIWTPTDVPETETPFRPHMSLAYINRDGPAGPLVSAIETITTPPATATIRQCQMIIINRDDKMYKWDVYASVNLGP
jgi:2'-5' RNA ligase